MKKILEVSEFSLCFRGRLRGVSVAFKEVPKCYRAFQSVSEALKDVSGACRGVRMLQKRGGLKGRFKALKEITGRFNDAPEGFQGVSKDFRTFQVGYVSRHFKKIKDV